MASKNPKSKKSPKYFQRVNSVCFFGMWLNINIHCVFHNRRLPSIGTELKSVCMYYYYWIFWIQNEVSVYILNVGVEGALRIEKIPEEVPIEAAESPTTTTRGWILSSRGINGAIFPPPQTRELFDSNGVFRNAMWRTGDVWCISSARGNVNAGSSILEPWNTRCTTIDVDSNSHK